MADISMHNPDFYRHKLQNAIDRRSRATTNSDWLHDQNCIDHALDDLSTLGYDRNMEWDRAVANIQKWGENT